MSIQPIIDFFTNNISNLVIGGAIFFAALLLVRFCVWWSKP